MTSKILKGFLVVSVLSQAALAVRPGAHVVDGVRAGRAEVPHTHFDATVRHLENYRHLLTGDPARTADVENLNRLHTELSRIRGLSAEERARVKETEDRLVRESEEALRKIVEATPFGKVAVTEGGQFTINYGSDAKAMLARIAPDPQKVAADARVVKARSASEFADAKAKLIAKYGKDHPVVKALQAYEDRAVARKVVPSGSFAQQVLRDAKVLAGEGGQADSLVAFASRGADASHYAQLDQMIENGGDAAKGLGRLAGLHNRLMVHEGIDMSTSAKRQRPVAEAKKLDKVSDNLAEWVRLPEAVRAELQDPKKFAEWTKDPEGFLNRYLEAHAGEAAALRAEMERNEGVLAVICQFCPTPMITPNAKACKKAKAA